MPTNLDLTPNSESNSNTVFGYFFAWLSSSGKYVLLVANILLFSLYIYRFNIDRKNILLTRDINKLNENITRNENSALEYKKLQNIALFIQDQKKTAVDPNFILAVLTNVTPTGVKVERLDVSNNVINLTATSFDPVTFTGLIDYFLTDVRYVGVVLTSSTYNEPEDSFTFNLQITLRDEI